MSELFEQVVGIAKAHADSVTVNFQRQRIDELERNLLELKSKVRESEIECDELRYQLRKLREAMK